MWGATGPGAPWGPVSPDFNPRSPCGERLAALVAAFFLVQISIHAPRVGSDSISRRYVWLDHYFNPRSPCGERLFVGTDEFLYFVISIHAPRVGSDDFYNPMFANLGISIHAPRVGSDSQYFARASISFYFNPRSPCGERQERGSCKDAGPNFNPRSPCGERQQRCTDFSFASSAKRVFFVIFSKLGAIFRGSAEKGGGDFLSRSVRTSRGKYGCLAFAFRESGGLRENRRFYSQSVLFSFRIDCQGSRIAGCPFRGP